MNNIVNQVAYLRTSREFPEEIHQLTVELTRAYIDTANAINNRIIGIFSVNKPSITGESWFLVNKRQQTFRQLYLFTAADVATGFIPHGLNNIYTAISYFTRMWGTYTDGTNWYGLIAGSNVAIAGQISFFIDPININFLVGAGAPAITKGQLVIEWLSEV